MLRFVLVVLIAAVTFSGCGGGGDDAVSFPAFVRAQIQATPALDGADAVPVNDIDFANVLREDEDQFADLLGN